MFLVRLLVSSSFNRWRPSKLWLKRCGAFLMESTICRTLERRSKLDELNADVDCFGAAAFLDATLPLPLSRIVGIAADDCPNPLLLLLLLLEVNMFSSLDVGFGLKERRFRNENDLMRLSLDGSWAFVEWPLDKGDCFWRSNNVETNWSNTFKSAFILEFRIALGDAVGLLIDFPFDESPRRFVIYWNKENNNRVNASQTCGWGSMRWENVSECECWYVIESIHFTNIFSIFLRKNENNGWKENKYINHLGIWSFLCDKISQSSH